MIRIKLIFDDNILMAEEYRKIWFLIPDTVHYVSDLVYLIKTKFSLKKTYSKGLYLLLDDFTLPLTQNIQLIRENDVIIVKSKAVQQRDSTANIATSSSSSSASDSSDSSDNSDESAEHHANNGTEHKSAPQPTNHNATQRTHRKSASSVSEASSDSDESDHVIDKKAQSRAVTNNKKQPRPESASHVTVVPQRRGETLGRGYRAPQWPWLPFTVAPPSDTSDTCHTAPAAAQSSVPLHALQREDVIAFRTMELDGWQPVLSPVKQATVRAVTPDSLTVRLLTGVTDDAEEVTLAAEDVIDLTVVNKHR